MPDDLMTCDVYLSVVPDNTGHFVYMYNTESVFGFQVGHKCNTDLRIAHHLFSYELNGQFVCADVDSD